MKSRDKFCLNLFKEVKAGRHYHKSVAKVSKFFPGIKFCDGFQMSIAYGIKKVKGKRTV